MKRGGLILFFISIIFIATIIFYIVNRDMNKVCFSNKCIAVELAQTNEDKARGLMFRETLGEDKGMLFIYDTSDFYTFWMKNTLIPLDIIWIDENFKIVDIKKAVPCIEDPCETYSPLSKAKYVIETNYDFTEKNNVSIGSRAVIQASSSSN